MNVLDAITNRRSVRKYNDKPITDEELNIILQAAMSAPSGLNLQPWYFVAVRSEEKKQEILSIMDEVSVKISGELDARFAKHPQVAAETKAFIRSLGNAQVVLLVFMMRDDYEDMQTALESVAAAIENSLLAARSLEIGSCWLTAATQVGFSDEVRDRFAPGKGSLVATVTLGHTDTWPRPIKHKDGRYEII